MSAKMKSFQEKMKQNIAVVATTLAITGKTTRPNRVKGLATSTLTAYSTSMGR